MFSAPIFLLLASVIQYASSEKYAYIKLKIPVIECTDIPNDGICPRDHKTPDLSNITDSEGKSLDYAPDYPHNKTIINGTLTSILMTLKAFGANETCKRSFRDYICSQFFPDCEDDSDFFYINGEKVLKSCEQAKKDCSALPSFLITAMLNCTATGRMKIPKRNQSCLAYPDIKDDPYPCSKRNITGPPLEYSGRNNTVLQFHAMLKKAANKLDQKCIDSVAQVVCEAAASACTRDEKYIVDLVSKQDCQRIMGCLNVTKDANLTNGFFELCGHLPDATTTKKIPLSDVVAPEPTEHPSDNPTTKGGKDGKTTKGGKDDKTTKGGTDDATTKGASIALMILAFLYFMQHLHYV